MVRKIRFLIPCVRQELLSPWHFGYCYDVTGARGFINDARNR